MVKERRREDIRPSILLAEPKEWTPDEEAHLPEAVDVARALPLGCGDEDGLVVLMQQEGETLAIAAARVCRIPAGAEDLMSFLPHLLGKERALVERRNGLPDQLIAYFEELNAASTEDEVLCALAEHAPRMVGAHRAYVLARKEGGATARVLTSRHRQDAAEGSILDWVERLESPGLFFRMDASGSGGYAALAPLGISESTEIVAHVPVEEEGALVLTERREDRIFDEQDWDLLRALALQARMVLRRVRLLDSVSRLSLTDTLTGLANRRHMNVVLEHAWAAALRAEPLTVMVMDLDDFKQVNDTLGHDAGDRLLCEVAEALRTETRGADVVVRYGGDEFLVVLPGGDGAGLLADRLQRRLAGRIRTSFGIAAYHPGCACPDDLIREADRRLYEAKRRRKAG
jgi:diguanylate cyclase (GGDEF)-like protein